MRRRNTHCPAEAPVLRKLPLSSYLTLVITITAVILLLTSIKK